MYNERIPDHRPAAPAPQRNARGLFMRWLREEAINAPLVPVLHPSPVRMKSLGFFTLVGHPLFWFIWAVWIPQPYENLGLRLFTALLGLPLMSDRVSRHANSPLASRVFTAVSWFELPFLFSWMYLCNSGNPAWLASAAAMVLIYYHSTDWRLATLGLALGAGVARVLFALVGPAAAPMPPDLVLTNAVVLAFCVSMGILLGISSANLRREQLANTLATMGIMAHELRTPLATVSLLGDALRGAATEAGPPVEAKIESLAQRLHGLVRNMHHQIDTQIANARLLRLPRHAERVQAAALVADTVANYPFRNGRERDCVEVVVKRDFAFRGTEAQFRQVLDNLLKNALRSIAAATGSPRPGDLCISVEADGRLGRIGVTDRGIGIEPELLPRIFEPFFSTNHKTGHGLGLAFCREVAAAAHGSIRVKSEPGQGATFTVELPVLSPG